MGFVGSAFGGVSLASHEAVYVIEMKGVASGSEIATADGRSHYSLRKVCDGWVSSENYAVAFGFGEGGSSSFISHYESWESEDSRSFTFEVIENSNITGERSYEGFANSVGDIREAFHSDGDGEVRVLPSDTVFPIEHILSLMTEAEGGRVVVQQSHLFFGGEHEDSLYFINSIMGKKRAVEESLSELSDILGGLGEDGYWPLSIAYYDPDSREAEPEYAIAFELQSNGIIRGYTIDYGSFRLRARLTQLDPLDPEICE